MPATGWSKFSGGTQTAAFLASGRTAPGNAYTNSTFEYDGTNFSSGGNVNTTRSGNGGGGTLTAGFAAGGSYPGAPSPTANNGSSAHEQYNGTAWANAASMTYGVRLFGLAGTQDNLFAAGGRGNVSTATTSTQEYDGTSFATTASLGTGMNELGASGTSTAGLVNGGN